MATRIMARRTVFETEDHLDHNRSLPANVPPRLRRRIHGRMDFSQHYSQRPVLMMPSYYVWKAPYSQSGSMDSAFKFRINRSETGLVGERSSRNSFCSESSCDHSGENEQLESCLSAIYQVTETVLESHAKIEITRGLQT